MRFTNHDSRIAYYELMLERSLDGVQPLPLPAGYTLATYAPGDKTQWIAIEKSAREFDTFQQGEEAWQRYYAGREAELPGRMFFVENARGQKVATATALYNIHTGDDGVTGWLHWVAVRRDAQGQGLSKPLIVHVLRRMVELGYRRCIIPTQTTTWLACKVYMDLGFTPIPRNLERSMTGWRIVKRLTDHPTLADLTPATDGELLAPDFSDPTIRPLRMDDKDALIRFFAQMGPDSRAFFNRHNGNFNWAMRYFDSADGEQIIRWVAVQGGDVVGYVFLWDTDTMIPWLGIAVSENMRGRHFGQRLIQTAEDWCRRMDKGGIMLTTHMANYRAQTLYETCGFTRLGVHSASNELLYLKRF